MAQSLIKRRYVPILLGVIFLAVSLMPLYAFLPSCLYWESRPYLANDGSLDQDIGFFVTGSYVKLDVYVYGGDGNISIQVLNVASNNITQEGSVDSSGLLTFNPPQNDHYSLYLQNDYGSQNGKQVLVKVYYYFYNYIFFTLASVALLLGAALIISYESRSAAHNRSISSKITFSPY
jgi:hypothetical protein